MEARAEFKYLRMPDRKIRVIMELIKGKRIEIAFNVLKFTPKRGSDIVFKLLRSAVNNVTQKQGVNLETLYVKTAYANQGPSFKKMHPRAMGRAGMIKRKFCHATIIVSDELPEKLKGRIKKEKVPEVKTEAVTKAVKSKKSKEAS